MFLCDVRDGKWGWNEIYLAMYKHLQILDQKKSYDILKLYCDDCAGQTRIQAMICIMLFFHENTAHVRNIKITYMLPGHSMTTVDTLYSTIGYFTRNRFGSIGIAFNDFKRKNKFRILHLHCNKKK